MRLGDLGQKDIARALASDGLLLHSGPFVARLRTRISFLQDDIAALYAEHSLADPQDFVDFDVVVEARRRAWRPKAVFTCGGIMPFQPLPLPQALALMEWGLNWAVVSSCQDRLILHAAVLVRDGRAIVLPGEPGAGKSTLTVALLSCGWKLLSDELSLIDRVTGEITGMPRPVSLKGASIAVAQGLLPDAVLSRPIPDTQKGLIRLLHPRQSLYEGPPVRAARIVFPRFTAGHPLTRTPVSKGEAFLRVAEQGFTYAVLGRAGFEAVGRLIDGCAIESIAYGDVRAAAEMLTEQPLELVA